MENLDCRGLACPGPVIQVKKVLEKTSPGGSFSIQLDSEASRDNVRRFAESKGALVHIEERKGNNIHLTISKPSDAQTPRHGDAEKKPPVVFIASDTLGKGDDKLGQILMEGFITTLLEQDQVPDRILFLNTGVKLAVEGSTVAATLEKLTDRGCEVLVCGTCLDFLGLMDQLVVGSVSNMYDIQGAMLTASSVISP